MLGLRHRRGEDPFSSDEARWISAFLRNIHATLIKRVKIVFKICNVSPSHYTPPINIIIIAELRRRCIFLIQDIYEARAIAERQSETKRSSQRLAGARGTERLQQEREWHAGQGEQQRECPSVIAV